MQRDSFRLIDNDGYIVVFDTFYDRRNGFAFRVNPIGGFSDQQVTDEGNPNPDFNPVWDVRTGRFDGGWTVEMEIPFQSIRVRPGPDQVWGIQLGRDIPSNYKEAYLTAVPISAEPGQFRLSVAGNLVGLEVPADSRTLDQALPRRRGSRRAPDRRIARVYTSEPGVRQLAHCLVHCLSGAGAAARGARLLRPDHGNRWGNDAMAISESLLPEFDQEMAGVRRTLERVPEDRFDWKPHPKSLSMSVLAGHLANLPSWGTMTIQQDELDTSPGGKPMEQTPPPASTAKLVATFDRTSAEARAALADASDAELMKPWTLLSNGTVLFSLPKVACFRSFVINHMIHHRAQLGVYLRINDVPVPSLYGPSADEMPPGF